METIKYSALFDELEKIAEEKRKDITKQRFKQHLKTLPAVFVGAGLGTAGGYAATRALGKRGGKVSKLLHKYPAAKKYIPAVAGGLGAAAGYVGKVKREKIKDYIEKKKDDKPK